MANSVASIKVIPTANDATVTIKVNGAAVTSGTASASISLAVGSNTITIIVTAQDGITTKSYIITATRAAAQVPSLSYSTPNTYTTGVAISPLTPINNGGIVFVPGYSSHQDTIGVGIHTGSIAIDGAGNVYVSGNNIVKEIPLGSGVPITKGSGFTNVQAIATDIEGNVYVIDGQLLKKIIAGGNTTMTIPTGLLSSASAIAADAAGNVYVPGYNFVYKIPDGGGSSIAIPSGILSPRGIAIDVAGNIFVGDDENSSNQNTTNSLIKEIPTGGGSPLAFATGFNYTMGVTVDAAGNVYASDFLNNVSTQNIYRIPRGGGNKIIIASGAFVPFGIAVDGVGKLYVADGTTAIKKITPIGGYYINPALPAGLNFNSNTGIISGTPTVASPATNYTITAYNSVGGNSVTVNIKVASNRANLTNLVLSNGILSPAFLTGTTSYTAGVSNATSTITVTPTADLYATVTVNGISVASGTTSTGISLAVGTNTITTIVTAQDGITTKTFTTTITRGQPLANALLSTIITNPGVAPVYTGNTGNTANYIAGVDPTTNSITLTPTAQDPFATITVNGVAVISGNALGPIALNIGATVIPIVVTAEDGTTIKNYSVTVNRAGTYNALLKTIAINADAGTAPVYINTTAAANYAAGVNPTTNNIIITPTAQDPLATVSVNGAAVTSGTASAPITLNPGSTTITIIVTAPDGVTTKTYLVTVNRTGTYNDMLKTVTINAGTSPIYINTTAAANYTAGVDQITNNVTLTPTVQDPLATVSVNGAAVTSGTASAPITLNPGPTTITIIVTAPDGVTTKTYLVTVNRTGTYNDMLSSIKINHSLGVYYSGTTSTVNYTASVDRNTGPSSIAVTPTAQDPLATIQVNGIAVNSGGTSGLITLQEGPTIITLVVTAPNGLVSKTYVVTVTKVVVPGFDALYQPISVVKPIDNVAVANDGIMVHQGLSPNGDGVNDFLVIDRITDYPNNSLMIMDSNGKLVYLTKGYDNNTKIFDGHNNINGKMQLPGTYFYSLDYIVNNQNKHKTGFIILKY